MLSLVKPFINLVAGEMIPLVVFMTILSQVGAGQPMAASGTAAPRPSSTPSEWVTVDPDSILVDNFDGWGTSLCWWANVCGGYSNRDAYAHIAFTTLGLNIVRYNIGGGENPSITNSLSFRARIPGFEADNAIWNWDADQNQRWMLKRAVALGANHVIAFANSPPWWMTVSHSVTGSTNGTSNNLQAGYENAFAQYLVNVVSNLTHVDGVKFDAITPMNEPAANWWVHGGLQEGCHMDPAQQNRVVTDLASALAGTTLASGIDASEDNDERNTINSLNGYDAVTKSKVTLIASHTYGANGPVELRNTARALRKPLWISEYADADASGLPMARRIHDDITQSFARAWVYWQVVDNYGGWGCLYNPEDGSGNTNFSYNEKFYVMWQFSHFIRPGFQIFKADDTNSLVAYDATNHHLVIVTLNESTNSKFYQYDLTHLGSAGSKAGCWRTSAGEQGAPLKAVSLVNRQFTAYAAPRSVTTFVISNVFPGSRPASRHPQDAKGNSGTLPANATYAAGKVGTNRSPDSPAMPFSSPCHFSGFDDRIRFINQNRF